MNTEGAGEGSGEGAGEHGGTRSAKVLKAPAAMPANAAARRLCALNQTYDVTRNGARLVMRYDEANNRFMGKVMST